MIGKTNFIIEQNVNETHAVSELIYISMLIQTCMFLILSMENKYM